MTTVLLLQNLFMSYKTIILTLLLAILAGTAFSQTIIIRKTPLLPPRPRSRTHRSLPVFRPSLNISAGYGLPVVDTKYLPAFYNLGRGDISQWGVLAGSVDYQFSRRMSIGVMAAHASFSAPYYGYFYPGEAPDLTAHFDNWAFMISLTRYFPISLRTSLYLRTAIGANVWQQRYTDASGDPATVTDVDLPSLAHQLALGMKFRVTRHARLFLEGGYGKYIVRAGLSAKL
jgi:hypothetical protein